MICYGVVASIDEGSIAEEIGLAVGDKILEINGQKLRDIIDLSFALADEEVSLLIEKKDGEREFIEFDKEYDEELGVEFENAVFDGIQRCYNQCWFCFVDQIAPNMRSSLAIKDDDYRMSFLYGNFVTLTNMKDEDFDRIKKLHLSPLFVSVHTTDGALRAKMLHNKSAANILEQLDRLKMDDIDFHTQIVLCPEINDGLILKKTLDDLLAFQPFILSVAIVPVGLTRYREGCHPLNMFTKEQANDVIDMIEDWKIVNRDKIKNNFVYLGDEFYFLAERKIPNYEYYDGFPQLENGIGLTRKFISEWEESEDIICNAYEQPIYLDVVCGKSAKLVLQPLIDQLEIPNLFVRLIAVENQFFGKDITVTGLLTGQDILAALQEAPDKRSGVIIPGVSLRSGENIFLDDYTLNDLSKDLDSDVRVANNGVELKHILLNWHEGNVQIKNESKVYTWQSNGAYSQNK